MGASWFKKPVKNPGRSREINAGVLLLAERRAVAETLRAGCGLQSRASCSGASGRANRLQPQPTALRA
jgi:hypothetical protein